MTVNEVKIGAETGCKKQENRLSFTKKKGNRKKGKGIDRLAANIKIKLLFPIYYSLLNKEL